jgi:hypothetical protein
VKTAAVHVLGTVFAHAGRLVGDGIAAGNSLIVFLAWRADGLTASLLLSSVITSVVVAAVGVLTCAAAARRALRVQPTEAAAPGLTCFLGLRDRASMACAIISGRPLVIC